MSQLEQQMRHRDRDMVPKALVQAMFGLMLGALLIVSYAQWRDVPNAGVLIEAPIVESLTVTLTGDRTGNYFIHGTDGALLASSSDDKAGFIGVMGKVVDRERLLRGIVNTAPLDIVRRENGNVAIRDISTGMNVELIGYGRDNVAAFANLLD